MTPTRELALQILKEFNAVASHLRFVAVYGGEGLRVTRHTFAHSFTHSLTHSLARPPRRFLQHARARVGCRG